MRLPTFSAAAAVGPPSRTYRGAYRFGGSAHGASGQPAVVLPSQAEAWLGLGEDAELADMAELDDGDEELDDGDEDLDDGDEDLDEDGEEVDDLASAAEEA
jgi:hypothetical protein